MAWFTSAHAHAQIMDGFIRFMFHVYSISYASVTEWCGIYIHMHYTVAEMLQYLIIKINKLRHQTLVLSPFPLLELASSSVLMVDTEFSLLSIESESDVTTFCLFIEAGKQAAIAVHANTMLLNMMKIR